MECLTVFPWILWECTACLQPVREFDTFVQGAFCEKIRGCFSNVTALVMSHTQTYCTTAILLLLTKCFGIFMHLFKTNYNAVSRPTAYNAVKSWEIW